MKKLAIGVLSLLLFLGLFVPVSAQENMMQKDQMFFVHEEVVPFNMVDQYEKTSKEIMQLFKDKNLGVSAIYASMRDDDHYYYIVPISSYASIDTIGQAFNEFGKAIMNDDNANKLMDENNDAIDYTHEFVLRKSADLSYNPKGSDMNPGDMMFIHWDFYTIKSGKMKEIIELGKKFKDLNMKKGIKTPYDVWFVDLGENSNVLVITTLAKDAADFYQTANKDNETMGHDADDLYKQMTSYTTKFTNLNGHLRPDLGYKKD